MTREKQGVETLLRMCMYTCTSHTHTYTNKPPPSLRLSQPPTTCSRSTKRKGTNRSKAVVCNTIREKGKGKEKSNEKRGGGAEDTKRAGHEKCNPCGVTPINIEMIVLLVQWDS